MCDTSHPNNVIRTGFIVLDSVPLRFEAFPDSTRRLLNQMAVIDIDTAAVNGCWMLESRGSAPTLAGGWGGGIVHWKHVPSTDSITFFLDRTSDSGNEAEVAFTPGGFTGNGQSWGMGIDYPDDLVAGDYVGPPDQRRCADAAAAFASMLEKLRKMKPPAVPPAPAPHRHPSEDGRQ